MKTLVALILTLAISIAGFLPAVHALAHGEGHDMHGTQTASNHSHSQNNHHGAEQDRQLHDAMHHTFAEAVSSPVVLSAQSSLLPYSAIQGPEAEVVSVSHAVPYQPPRHA